MSYTNTHAKDLNPMTSSIGLSSYTRFASKDANRPDLAAFQPESIEPKPRPAGTKKAPAAG